MDDLIKQRQAALAAAEAIEATATAEKRAFTPDELAAHAKHLDEAKALKASMDARAAREAERNELLPQLQGAVATAEPVATDGPRSVEVTPRDPGHYRPNGAGGASFFADLLAVKTSPLGDVKAAERLRETNAYERTANATLKSDDAGGGQEMVPPGYLQQLFVERAVGQSVLANLVTRMPLPEGVRDVTIPRMTGDATVDEHTEDTSVTPDTPETDDATATVYDLVGVVDASLFFRERSNPNIDAILARHFAKLQALKLDTRIANGSGTGQGKGVLNVSSINTATLSSDGDLSACYPKIADVIQQIEDGHYASPTAIAVAVRRWGAWAAELDSTNRPLIVPAGAGAMNPTAAAEGNPKPAAAGFTGYTVQGVPVYKVPALPTTLGGSTNEDAIAICDWEEIILFLSAVAFDVSEHVDFKKAGVSFRSRQQYALMTEHEPEAYGKITGAGLVAPTF